MTTGTRAAAPKSVELSDELRAGLRDLILSVADNKRLLGMRYAGWILGAPELEAGIACASMAQDEWGHGRLLYALLKDFGDDVDRLEHAREPGEYRSMAALDHAPRSWPELVVLNALVDTALTVQLEALRASTYTPLKQRVGKLLDEEQFHAAHGAAWFRRLAKAGADGNASVKAAVSSVATSILEWFGPDSPRARALAEAGVTDGTGSTLRTRYLERITPLLTTIDAADTFARAKPDFSSFDEARRRRDDGGPDADTIRQVRGDKNRAFLMD